MSGLRVALLSTALLMALYITGCSSSTGGSSYIDVDDLRLRTRIECVNHSAQDATFIVSTYDPLSVQDRVEVTRWDDLRPGKTRAHVEEIGLIGRDPTFRYHFCVTVEVGGQVVAEDCASIAPGDTGRFTFDGARLFVVLK